MNYFMFLHHLFYVMLIIACLHTKTPRGHFGAFLVYLLIIAFTSCIKTLQAPGLVL
jgi:hypothetical protein